MAKQEKKKNVSGLGPLYFFGAIIIPLISLAVTYISNIQPTPVTGLSFLYTGPVAINDKKAFEISVTNNGRNVEKNVEIWLPNQFSSKEAEIESDVNYKLRVEQNKTVISIGDIRIKEKISLKFLVKNQMFKIYDFEMQELKIRSVDHIASYGGLTEDWLIFYRASFWAVIGMFSMMIGIGIYESIMSFRLRKVHLKRNG